MFSVLPSLCFCFQGAGLGGGEGYGRPQRPGKHSGAFKFDTVPAPIKDNAATRGKFTVVDGTVDPNSPGLSPLNDGILPDSEDQPDNNFFFTGDGGRLALDLGTAIDIKQVNTYSWHPTSRGPQVYKLYISDGKAADFDKAPSGVDPRTVGWKFVADVDTRQKQDPSGGQFGVSIADATAPSIGHARYLLFDVSPAEPDNVDGNTFYSEIDVIDKNELLGALPATQPGDQANANSPYDIIINTDEVPDMKAYADHLRPILEKWYPILVKLLPSNGYTAPKRFTITFRKDKPGVADTSGTRRSTVPPTGSSSIPMTKGPSSTRWCTWSSSTIPAAIPAG